MLKTKDYEKILDFLSLIESRSPNYCQTVINSLKEVFNYSYIAFFVNGNNRRPIASNISENIIEEYANQFYKLDIFNNKKMHQSNVVITIEDIMPYSQYVKTQYYEQFHKRHNLDYSISIPLTVDKKVIGGIGIHKTKDCGDFTPGEKGVFANISKFISLNLNRNLENNHIEFENSMLTTSLDTLPIGVLVLDSDLKIIYHNTVLMEYCSDIAATTNTDPINKMKGILLSQYFSFDKNKANLDIEIGNYFITIRSLPDIHYTFHNHKSLFSIYFQPKSQDRNMIHQAIEEFGLSKREAEIIEFISMGYSNNEIANMLYLSINTVKSHLTNIFNKLNVNNRTAVIHKISHLK